MKFKINAGELRHPISIQRTTTTLKENIPLEKTEELFKTKAKIINGHGDEYLKNYGLESKVTKTFYIRYNRSHEVTHKDYVIYKDEKYNIVYVNNIEEMNRYLELKCEVIT